MVEKYNSTYHRSINLKPTDARKPANYKHIHNALYAKVNARKATPPKFHVGDKVRIVRKKGTFEMGCTPNWATYTIGEPFTNRSCRLACRRSTVSNGCSRWEKTERVFVKWKGYSSAFNSDFYDDCQDIPDPVDDASALDCVTVVQFHLFTNRNRYSGKIDVPYVIRRNNTATTIYVGVHTVCLTL